jgi:hypothetical protein
MHKLDFFSTLLSGAAILLLPVVLPLFFFSNIRRRTLFYFVGLASSFLCYKVATFGWAFLAVFLGYFLAFWRHENSLKAIEYGFALAIPGLKEGHMFWGLLPVLTLGTLLSVIALRKIKDALFKALDSADAASTLHA